MSANQLIAVDQEVEHIFLPVSKMQTSCEIELFATDKVRLLCYRFKLLIYQTFTYDMFESYPKWRTMTWSRYLS